MGKEDALIMSELREKHINHALQITAMGDEVDVRSAESVKATISKYFALCKYDAILPSIEGLSTIMNMDRMKLIMTVNGRETTPIVRILRKAFRVTTIAVMNSMIDGAVSAKAAEFVAYNNLGYDSKPQLTVQLNVGSDLDISELEHKYKDIPAIKASN